jgi:F0F1-type ATP synthase beta subunit
MNNSQGKVIQIIGPVIDVSFPIDSMSTINIYDAIIIEEEKKNYRLLVKFNN